jgi:hypothetical protein
MHPATAVLVGRAPVVPSAVVEAGSAVEVAPTGGALEDAAGVL